MERSSGQFALLAVYQPPGCGSGESYNASMPHADGTLKAREFLFFCEDQALATLGPAFPQPQRHLMWTILQFHYGLSYIHFELQPQVSRGQVELGLHFEGPLEVNEAWASLVAGQTAPVLGALGPGWELEEWTASWRRIHRVFAFDKLTATLGREVAGQFATLMQTLQPIVQQGLLEIHPITLPAPAHSTISRRWHQRTSARR
jgi:hypothetical protein